MSRADNEDALTRDDVREIIDIVDASHIGELSLELGDLRLYVRKVGEQTRVQVGAERARSNGAGGTPPTAAQDPVDVSPPTASSPEEPAMHTEAPAGLDPALHAVTAPMVGVFYRTPAPDQPQFVEVGDRVAPDDVVCLIEVMKLFNSVRAGVAGRVAHIHVENGATVEYGQPLLAIEPLAEQ